MLQRPSAVVAHFDEEVWNRKNLAVVDELVSEDVVIHTFDTTVHGRDSWKRIINRLLKAIPDFHSTTEFTIEEGDRVAARYVASGTHSGEYQGIPPTGRHISIAGDSIFRIVAGRIVEIWRHPDSLGFMRQIGAIPG